MNRSVVCTAAGICASLAGWSSANVVGYSGVYSVPTTAVATHSNGYENVLLTGTPGPSKFHPTWGDLHHVEFTVSVSANYNVELIDPDGGFAWASFGAHDPLTGIGLHGGEERSENGTISFSSSETREYGPGAPEFANFIGFSAYQINVYQEVNAQWGGYYPVGEVSIGGTLTVTVSAEYTYDPAPEGFAAETELFTTNVVAVPEPASLGLTAVAGLLALRRRRGC